MSIYVQEVDLTDRKGVPVLSISFMKALHLKCFTRLRGCLILEEPGTSYKEDCMRRCAVIDLDERRGIFRSSGTWISPSDCSTDVHTEYVRDCSTLLDYEHGIARAVLH